MKLTDRRTQIYLSEDQYQAAARLARERGESLAAVVREALDRFVAGAGDERRASWEGDPAAGLVGCLTLPPLDLDPDGPAGDLNEAIDQSVYGET